jgi:hypothetical protein
VIGSIGIPYQPTKEYYSQVALGLISGYSVARIAGHSLATTTLSPVTESLVYSTPTAAAALEFVSSSVNDTSAGSGAREVTVVGLDSNWAEVTQTVTTNGTTAVALATNLIRLHRWYVSSSGSYATSGTSSHVGTLTIRVSGAGATWSQIALSGSYGLGASEIGFITIPLNKTAYILSKNVILESAKTADVFLFQRPLANDVTTPYPAMRLIERVVVLAGMSNELLPNPVGPFVGPCDLGFMAKTAAGTCETSVSFSLLVVG